MPHADHIFIPMLEGTLRCVALSVGKTYVGVKVVQTLVAHHAAPGPRRLFSTEPAAAGPILLVTMTNHALDQFMEGLLKAGISAMVRVGGRSKSELLEHHNLNSLWKDYRSKGEKQRAYDLHQSAPLVQHKL